MEGFVYDPEIIREFAEKLVCPGSLNPCEYPWNRYEIAGIEAYSELYHQSFMEEIIMGWDEARGDQPAWACLDNRERHMVIAYVAHWHQKADSDYYDDEWSSRIALVFQDDVAEDPSYAIGR